MAIFKYYLERRKDKDGNIKTKNVPIIYSFSFNGYRLKSTVGERIDHKHWDEKKERVKGGREKLQINQRLETFREKVLRLYRESDILGEVFTPETLKQKLNSNKNGCKKLKEYFNEFLDSLKNTCTPGTIRKYKSVGSQLEIYINNKRRALHFNDFTPELFEELVTYYINVNKNTNNTIAKNIKVLKRFLSWALDKGYHSNEKFKKYTFSEKEGEIIVLSMEELMHLYNFTFKQKYLEQVRDVFCFGCFTSLRYSDIANLKRTQINNNTLRFFSIKTKELIEIPLNNYAQEILAKYSHLPDEKCLPVISNQKMNLYLKDIGKAVGFNDHITIVRYQGSRRIEESTPKHQLLTSHVARKTFITNAFRLGIPSEIIMMISGHKDHRVFKRYNKIAQDQLKEAMNKFNNVPNGAPVN
ncbi:site-specific integrase [Carboxylicivirga mesophila]|uniref:Site-specific integrase n=1 Tax=Carboxylicivirga mesophila TaxID=1166478 RepID=A0ABS5K5N8_9BACT|nr:site-specific integrase [Carboxylicivirga mesophila]MBS2210266.1 site-specific integrase [Carboxylicivirga mesophila]